MPILEELLSIRSYAKTLKISESSVRKAIQKGKIQKGVSYVPGIKSGTEIYLPKINKTIADIEWGYRHFIDPEDFGITSTDTVEKNNFNSASHQGKNCHVFNANKGTTGVDFLLSYVLRSGMGNREINRLRKLFNLAIDQEILKRFRLDNTEETKETSSGD